MAEQEHWFVSPTQPRKHRRALAWIESKGCATLRISQWGWTLSDDKQWWMPDELNPLIPSYAFFKAHRGHEIFGLFRTPEATDAGCTGVLRFRSGKYAGDPEWIHSDCLDQIFYLARRPVPKPVNKEPRYKDGQVLEFKARAFSGIKPKARASTGDKVKAVMVMLGAEREVTIDEQHIRDAA